MLYCCVQVKLIKWGLLSVTTSSYNCGLPYLNVSPCIILWLQWKQFVIIDPSFSHYTVESLGLRCWPDNLYHECSVPTCSHNFHWMRHCLKKHELSSPSVPNCNGTEQVSQYRQLAGKLIPICLPSTWHFSPLLTGDQRASCVSNFLILMWKN